MELEEIQRLNLQELNNFRNLLEGEKCVLCGEKPFAITRTKILCRRHYKFFVRDNKQRIEKEKEITTELDYLDFNEEGKEIFKKL